jgi:phosphotransferase system HPr (HPr) family protein
MDPDRSQTATRRVEITNALGLHLRPANKFVNLADRYESEIRVQFRGRSFDGKSILDLTSLAAEQGSLLDLEAVGPDAEVALEALAELVRNEFHEDENGNERPPSLPAGGADSSRSASSPGSGRNGAESSATHDEQGGGL